MTEEQGTQLLEKVAEMQEAMTVGNTVLYALFACVLVLVAWSSFRAVRRG